MSNPIHVSWRSFARCITLLSALAACGPEDSSTLESEPSPVLSVPEALVTAGSCSPDVTPPTVTCPSSITLQCIYSGQTPLSSVSVSDNCGISYVSNPPQYIGRPSTWTSSVFATDTSNNSASCSTVWTVVDTYAPSVTLQGSTSMTLAYGTAYMEPGFYTSDQCDGYYLAERVQRSGWVNTQVPGTYTLTYKVTDYAGNVSPTVTRQVKVLPP